MSMLPTPGTQVFEETDTALEPPYHLILLDDDDHTYGYVISMLQAVFGYSRDKGFAIACIVDAEGRAIVMTGSMDEVRPKQEMIHAYGADSEMANSKGSMTAIIEPAVSPG